MLLDKQDRGRKGAITGLYQTRLQHYFNLLFNFLLLEMGVPIGADIDGCSLGKKMDTVVCLSLGWKCIG